MLPEEPLRVIRVDVNSGLCSEVSLVARQEGYGGIQGVGAVPGPSIRRKTRLARQSVESLANPEFGGQEMCCKLWFCPWTCPITCNSG